MLEVANGYLGDKPNQKERMREDVYVMDSQITDVGVPGGTITEAGLRTNVSVGMQYLNSWLMGNGAVAIHNLMEDAATAEISRSQIWQWIHHGAALDDGRPVTAELYAQIRSEELEKLGGPDQGRLGDAAALLDQLCLSDSFIEFLTYPAYEMLE